MKLKYKNILLAGLSLMLGTALCGQQAASADYISEEDFYAEDLASAPKISDPFERVNRVTFQFNDFFYTKVVKPVSETYQKVTPDPVEEGAINFFNNLRFPVRLAGNLLQARWDGALVETKRFAVNTTVGFFGVGRPADDVEGLARIPAEDIGQAFAVWGIGEGPYLVLPFLGPSNARDLGGFVADRMVNPFDQPFSAVDHWGWETRLGIAATEFVVRTPYILERYIQMRESAIDPYSSVKNGYTQFRRAEIKK